eukprot:3583609-Prymnesium_polylepis.1
MPVKHISRPSSVSPETAAGAHSENRQLGDAAIPRERCISASGLHLLVGLWVGFKASNTGG